MHERICQILMTFSLIAFATVAVVNLIFISINKSWRIYRSNECRINEVVGLAHQMFITNTFDNV